MVENKNKFVAIPIPVSCREKEKGDYIHYILDKTAGKYAGYRFFCASRFVKTEKEAKPENNGKLCDYLIMPRDRFVKLIAKDKSIDINSGDFQKLMKAIINDNVKKINLEKKKPRYLKAYLPSELRAKLYKKTQSYILDDRYGKYDGFYVNLPVNLISADEDVRVNDYVIKADKFSKEASQTIKLKKGEETIAMPCDEFIALCKEALITESALVKENKRKEKIVKDTIEILGGEIEEGIYKDEETNKKIVYIVDQNRYLIVEDDDLELNENFELVISDEAKNRLAQTALKKESDGKGIFYDTVEDAKIALYSDDSDFIAGLSEEDAAIIEDQYRELILSTDKTGSIPSKKEFSENFAREKAWAPYLNYVNDKAYEKNVPNVFRDKPVFVCWRLEYFNEDGKPLRKPAKMPYNPINGKRAMSNNPSTWSTFENAIIGVEKYGFNGIGIMFSKQYKILGIDIDHCIDDNGQLSEMARDVVERVNCYTEYSPSGKGLHIITYGNVPSSKRLPSIEIYNETHFVTLTGHVFENKYGVKKVKDVQPELDYVWEKYVLPYTKPVSEGKKTVSLPSAEERMSDEEMLKKIARSTRTSGKFMRLSEGLPPFIWDVEKKAYTDKIDTFWFREDGSVDQSRIDGAFAKILVYFGATAEQIDRIYRSYPIYRSKWDEKRGNTTYGNLIIAHAFESTTKTYDFLPVKKNIIDNTSVNE